MIAVLLATCLAAPAAWALDIPECEDLRAWGEAPAPDYDLNAGVSLPGAFAPEATASAFGPPFPDWTAGDVRALDGALDRCRRAAATARDTEASAAFTALRNNLARAGRALRDLTAARETVEKALADIANGPQTPQLLKALQDLAALDEPGLRDFRTNLSAVGRLVRSLPHLPAAERAAAQAAVGAQAASLGADMTEERLAAIATLPDTAGGILEARSLAFAARQEMGAGAEPVLAAAAAREAAIAAALAAGADRPIALPDCPALFAWAEDLRPGTSRPSRAGPILTALEAPELAALFAKPFPDWTADDLVLLGSLAGQCRAAARAGLLDGEPRELDRRAARVVELHARAGDQPPRFAELAAARQAADRLIAEAAAAPESPEGLTALQFLQMQAEGGRLEPDDVERVRTALAARRAGLVEAILAAPRAAMTEAPADLAGLAAVKEAYLSVATAPVWFQLGEADRQGLAAEAERQTEARAAAAAPEFEAALAALPETSDGLAALDALAARSIGGQGPAWAPYHAAVAARREAITAAVVTASLPQFEAELAAIPVSREGYANLLFQALFLEWKAEEESPAFAPLAERAAARAQVVRAALAAERCAPALAAAGISASDTERKVLVGSELVGLDRFVCALAAQGGDTLRYARPGFFGSEHRVEFVGPGGYQVTIRLREVEVRPGAAALVGTRFEDPTGGRDLGLDDWRDEAAQATGIAPDACGFLLSNLPRERLAFGEVHPDDRNRLVDCLITNPEEPAPSVSRG